MCPPSGADGVAGGEARPAPDDDVDARLGRLEDAAQIRRLTQEYRRLLDARDLDGYGRLFADDGEWLGGTGYGQTPAGITAMLNERLPARSSGRPGGLAPGHRAGDRAWTATGPPARSPGPGWGAATRARR